MILSASALQPALYASTLSVATKIDSKASQPSKAVALYPKVVADKIVKLFKATQFLNARLKILIVPCPFLAKQEDLYKMR